MTSNLDDEDYWNVSKSKAFSFDEEEFNYKSTLFNSGKGNTSKQYHEYGGSKTSFIADTIFEGIPKTNELETIQRPLTSLVSKSSLAKIFGDKTPLHKYTSSEEELRILRRQVENQWTPPDVSKTVKQIMFGQPFSLHLYCSLDLKTELLDEAIKSGDGNAILAVVLFLSKSLKKPLFYQLMQKRPVAITHYVQYLSIRLMVSELIDLLVMLKNHREAAIKQFKFLLQGTQDVERKLEKLKYCYSNHFSMPDAREKQFVVNFIRYLEWLLAVDPTRRTVPSKSVSASLSYLCRHHWNDPKTSMTSPSVLATQQGVADRHYQWIVLTTRASLQAWEDIESLFITKGWLGGKKLKSVVSIEKIITELHKNGAPSSVLAQYLEVVDNLEKKLELAKRLSCHKVAIDVYVALKDRQGLMEYMNVMNPPSGVNLNPDDYIYAENAMRSAVKWKN